MKKRLSFIPLAIALILCTLLCVSCGSDPQNTVTFEKAGEISDIEKGYFGKENSSVTIELSDYIKTNTADFVFSAESSDTSIASAEVKDTTLTVTLLKGEGSSIVTVKASSAQAGKDLTFSFTVTARTYNKIACVGDSLTYGHSWHDESYPVYLQELLGSSVSVENFGKNGASVTGFNPPLNLKYTEQSEYTASMEFDADVVVIMLGTNDSKGWSDAKPVFETQYKELIGLYRDANPDVRVILVTAPPTLENNKFSIPCDVILDSVVPVQLDVAEQLGLPLVDFSHAVENYPAGYFSLIRGDAAFDGVHLTVEGAQLLANLVADAIHGL